MQNFIFLQKTLLQLIIPSKFFIVQKFSKSIKEVIGVFQQIIDTFFYKKKSATFKNQDFSNYLGKIVKRLMAIGPISIGKTC